MKRVHPGRRASMLAALAVVFAACEGGTDAPRPTTAVAASATSQTALVGTAVTEAPAVRVSDQQGQPMAGVAVTFVVSAGGGTLGGGTAITNAQGVAASTGWTLGSAAGQNVVTASVGSLTPVQFTATAQPRAPTTVTATTPVNQTGPANTPVAVAPGVVVNDQRGAPMAGVVVTFAVTAGGGMLGTTTATTNASGQASAVSWTLGPNLGLNTVTATVAGLAPVTFSATAQVDPCTTLTTYTLFATIQASLATSDCRLDGGYLADIYGLTLPTAQRLELRMTSGAVDSWLELYDSQGNFVAGNDDVASADVNAVVRAYVPAGNYLFAATTAFANEVGAYQISSVTFADNVSCGDYWLAPGVTVPGTLSASDCGSAAGFSDQYLLVLDAGQTITVRMESAQVDPVVQLYDVDGLVASNDNGGGGTAALLTYTATDLSLFLLNAGTAAAGQTGAYTLTVTRPAAAGAHVRADRSAAAEMLRQANTRARARADVRKASARLQPAWREHAPR